MNIKLQIVIENAGESFIEEITCLKRDKLSAETLVLSLKESKTILADIQKSMVTQQVAQYVASVRRCDKCRKLRAIHGYNTLTYRTLFGKLCFKSPRLTGCYCQSPANTTFSPISKILEQQHTAPEFKYLQSKWAALFSYGTTAKILEEVLPLQVHTSSIYCNTQNVAKRIEDEIGEEQHVYINGCERDWGKLPKPDTQLTVGLDGGYVHAREGANRKAGSFEIIVGKILQEQHKPKRFGFVLDYDTKKRRHVYEMLQEQGLQMNQAITFLTDGGDTVLDLTYYLSPQSEHVLDWFHITMRLTVMQQMAKNVVINDDIKLEKELDSIKHYLWHGNTFQALLLIEELMDEFDPESKNAKQNSLAKALDEFYTYINNNRAFIINYGESYRYEETISTAFVESTVNEVISKGMVKKQQMRWTKKGAHLLLQVRIKVLNDTLKQTFSKWYPNMGQDNKPLPLAA